MGAKVKGVGVYVVTEMVHAMGLLKIRQLVAPEALAKPAVVVKELWSCGTAVLDPVLRKMGHLGRQVRVERCFVVRPTGKNVGPYGASVMTVALAI